MNILKDMEENPLQHLEIPHNTEENLSKEPFIDDNSEILMGEDINLKNGCLEKWFDFSTYNK